MESISTSYSKLDYRKKVEYLNKGGLQLPDFCCFGLDFPNFLLKSVIGILKFIIIIIIIIRKETLTKTCQTNIYSHFSPGNSIIFHLKIN